MIFKSYRQYEEYYYPKRTQERQLRERARVAGRSVEMQEAYEKGVELGKKTVELLRGLTRKEIEALSVSSRMNIDRRGNN